MLHPSEVMMNENGVPNSPLSRHIAKGFLLQQRLLREMQIDDGTFATGVHAMFVYYAITRQPVQQWETIRVAIQRHRSRLSDRTVKLIAGVFKQERGKRCGPLTVRALVQLFASRQDMFHTCLILANVRQKEMSRQKMIEGENVRNQEAPQLVPVLKFSKSEQEQVLARFFQFPLQEEGKNNKNNVESARQQYISQENAKHIPLLKKLLSGDMKPFTKEEAASSLTSSSKKSPSVPLGAMVETQEMEESDEFVTNLLSLVSSTSFDKNNSVELRNSKKNTTNQGNQNSKAEREEQEKIQPKFVSPGDLTRFVQEQSNAVNDPDFESNSIMASFLAREQHEKQREKFFQEKKATAWMNPEQQ
jgi:hypothetical protein